MPTPIDKELTDKINGLKETDLKPELPISELRRRIVESIDDFHKKTAIMPSTITMDWTVVHSFLNESFGTLNKISIEFYPKK